MSLDGQSEMVTKTGRDDIYCYSSGQSQSFSDSALSSYSYSGLHPGSTTDYAGYNSHDLGATPYGNLSHTHVQEMNLKTDAAATWPHLSNASGQSLTSASAGNGSGYGGAPGGMSGMNSASYFQTAAATQQQQQQQQHSPSQQAQNHQSSTTSSASTTPSGVATSQAASASVKYEDGGFSQSTTAHTATTSSQSQNNPQQSPYTSTGSGDLSSMLGGTGGGAGGGGNGNGGNSGSSGSGNGGSAGGSGGSTGAGGSATATAAGQQAHYSSYLDQGIKGEDSPYRYSCGSTTSGPGGSPGTRSVAGSSHNSQDSDYSGPTSQQQQQQSTAAGGSSVYGLMGMAAAVTSTATSTQSSVVANATMKTEANDPSYYMPTTCSTAFMSGLSSSQSISGSGSGGYSPLPDASGMNSLHQQYKLKSETGYYSGSHLGATNSSPDYSTSGYSSMDRYGGYKRVGPYDRVVGPQQTYGRQRETPPRGLTPPLGGVGQNYSLDDLAHQQHGMGTHNHQQQMAAMMYGMRGTGNPSPHHHQSELGSMHQVLPQIESLYNRTGSTGGAVSPMSHLLYGSPHVDGSHQAARQLSAPMSHVLGPRHGATSLYGQDPDMQQIQTMVQSYTGRPAVDHHHPHHPHHQRPLVDMEGDPPRTTPPVVWTDPKMDFPLPEVRDIAGTFLMLEKQLCEALRVLEFRSPVEYIYNPMEYAWDPHSNYVQRYCTTQKPVLFLGMNPGPFGMAQTGVPFGEVTLVKEWMGVTGNVNKPVREHPKKLILGFDCPRSEISGSRFWGFFKKYCGKPDNFFRYCFVHNICPLIFMNHNAKNITPPQLPVVERKPLNRLCSQHLCDVVRLLNAKIVIGIGKFAQDQAKMALEEAGITGVKVTWIMHPSPANPIANRGWEEVAKRQLEEMDVLKYIVDQTAPL